jgi:hypothetical protein
LALIVGAVYIINPSLFIFTSSKSGFVGTLGADANTAGAGHEDVSGNVQRAATLANPNAATTPQVANLINQLSAGLPGVAAAKPTGGVSGFANMEDVTGPSEFASADGPAGCYPRDQLTPSELLPKDPNSVWAQQNPMGQGSLKGKNFLSAGALIGVNTVGQSLRNANLQLRSEPANPQVPVSVFYNSTIEPDSNRRDMEIN